jgi:hypothetical protein
MKAHRHAANCGTNLIALQHPSETLPVFRARCMELDGQPAEPLPEPENVGSARLMCESCGDSGWIEYREGAMIRQQPCPDCPAIEDQPS